jgi:hypothetical protein
LLFGALVSTGGNPVESVIADTDATLFEYPAKYISAGRMVNDKKCFDCIYLPILTKSRQKLFPGENTCITQHDILAEPGY